MAEITRRASTIVADLERFLAGGKPEWPNIAAAHGWPDPAQVRANIAALKPLGDLTVTFDAAESEQPVTSQPVPAPPAPRPALAPAPDTIANLLAAAHQHDKPAIKKQAEKVEALIKALRDAIVADREDAARRKEIAELEAKLAELKGATTTKAAKRTYNITKGDFPCPDCDRHFDRTQALSAHTRAAHKSAS